MTIREALIEGRALLNSPSSSAAIDTPALDAALLLGAVLGKSRTELVTRENAPIAEAERERFFCFLARRRNGECVAYILGRREFRGLEFDVNPHVLVPRPDTEILVEAALEHIGIFTTNHHEPPRTLLDLCAGSGAVAVSLKNECPFLHVTASDISPEALEIARRNAARLLDIRNSTRNHGNSVSFIQSDLFRNIPGRFDIIVSNPPYIPSSEISDLAPEVRREPRLALDGGGDGLDLIRKIIAGAGERLSPGGSLLLEADPRQMPAIQALFADHGFGNVRLWKDLAGRDRVVSSEMLATAVNAPKK